MIRLRPPSFEPVLTCVFALAGFLWGGTLGLRQIAGIDSGLDRLEYMTLDWRFLLAGARAAPRGVVVAAIDDETIREAGGYPLPRNVVARIVRGIAGYDPQAIALDMVFLDPGNPEGTTALADALRRGRSVVAAVGRFDRDRSGLDSQWTSDDLLPTPSQVLAPITTIADAARTGLVNISTDHAGVPRYVPLVFRIGDSLLPSFALAVAAAALNTEPVFVGNAVKLAGRTVSLDLGYHLPIRYYGPRGSVRYLSAADVLRGTVNPDAIRGQVIVLGATGIGVGDTFATPFDRIVPGAEIFATAVTNLLAGDGLIRTTSIRWIDAGTAALLPPVLVLLMAMRRNALGLGLVAVVLAAWIGAVFAGFEFGVWFNVAVPLAAALPAAASYAIARLLRDRYVSARLDADRATLSKFQSPVLVEHILRNPSFLEQPVQQQAAVVFLDLSGFTGVAERLGPQWTRDLLLAFQTIVERDVVEHGGYVVSFMGDGAMFVFGLTKAREDDGSRALLAIVKVRKSLTEWVASLPPVAKEPLTFRMGAHAGPVVLSRLGPRDHQHITATGDTVNVASRLLEIAKQLRASIVVTEDLWDAADAKTQSMFSVENPALTEVDIRGRSQSLRIRFL
jgi:adenylate cyclase